MATLLLNRSEVTALLDPAAIVPVLEQAFVAYSAAPEGRAKRVRSNLPASTGTTTVLFPGTAPGIPAYTVKVHAKFPHEHPAIRGVICLHSLASGELLAVMDSTHLTAVRTGLAGALAAHVLARRDATAVAVIGAGLQGEHQLRSLSTFRALERVRAYDLLPERSAAYARSMSESLGLAVEPATSLEVALEEADIVLIATWARDPFLKPGMLAPGAHVTTLGADEPGKAEVAAEVIRESLFVCDDRALAVEMGALGGVGLGSDAACVELGEILGGTHPGRTSDDQTTIYGGVGLAFQDAVAAWTVYESARACGAGREIDFLA